MQNFLIYFPHGSISYQWSTKYDSIRGLRCHLIDANPCLGHRHGATDYLTKAGNSTHVRPQNQNLIGPYDAVYFRHNCLCFGHCVGALTSKWLILCDCELWCGDHCGTFCVAQTDVKSDCDRHNPRRLWGWSLRAKLCNDFWCFFHNCTWAKLFQIVLLDSVHLNYTVESP